MPVYEFHCEETGETRELWLTFRALEQVGDGWVYTDLETGKTYRFRRVYNAPAIQFKGSGWACKG